MTHLIKSKELRKQYGDHTAVDGVTFNINPGEADSRIRLERRKPACTCSEMDNLSEFGYYVCRWDYSGFSWGLHWADGCKEQERADAHDR